MNRDTLYSAAVFDLDAGPVTITLPDAGKRFMALQAINRDDIRCLLSTVQQTHPHQEKIGTRYVLVGVRTLVDPFDPTDMHALKTLSSRPTTGTGQVQCPNGTRRARKKVRDALIVLGTT
jgi:hypothetical protein